MTNYFVKFKITERELILNNRDFIPSPASVPKLELELKSPSADQSENLTSASGRFPIPVVEIDEDPWETCGRLKALTQLTPTLRTLEMSANSHPHSLDTNEHVFITHIIASGVTSRLRRLPAGFNVIVEVDGNITQTSNELKLTGEDSVGWDEEILLLSNPSSSVLFSVYASFELGPRLGNGELLHQFKTTVGEVLGLDGFLLPTDSAAQKDELLPSLSSLRIIIERRICETSGSCPKHHLPEPNVMKELEQLTDEGHYALVRYQRLQDQADLGAAVRIFERVQEMCPLDHPNRSAVLSNLANAKFIHCQVKGLYLDIDVPIGLYRDALRLRSADHLDRCTTALELSYTLLTRSQKQGDPMDKEEATDLLMEVVEVSAPESYANRAGRFGLQVAKSSVSTQTTDAASFRVQEANLDDLIQRSQDRLYNLSSRNPRRRALLFSLGMLLSERFEQNDKLVDINAAILMLENAMDLTPHNHPLMPRLLTNLGDFLFSRFERLGDPEDINRSVAVLVDVVDLTSDANPEKSARLSLLGISLLRRFQRLGDIDDINRSILMVEKAICLTPDSHPGKPGRLNNLGTALNCRFERLGDLADMNRSITTMEDTVRLTPNGHPSRPGQLGNLGNSLLNRFERFGDLSDITRSISLFEEAVCITPDGHPVKPTVLINLGNSLSRRFQRLGNLSDINQSISLFEEVLCLMHHSHPKRPDLLMNFANSLFSRFERLGNFSDINRSISVQEEAICLTPNGHPNKPTQLNNLGNLLQSRFERLGDITDINRSISVMEDAVLLTPDGHPVKPARLSNLGNSLLRRFQRIQDLTDIDRSISLFEEAISLTPDAHPVKPAQLNSLGNSLSHRFQRLGNLPDINRSILMFEEAALLTPEGHPVKPARLSNLGDSLTRRFDHLGDLADINKSVSVEEEAVYLTPDSHPIKPARLNNLGNSLFRRFEQLGDPADINRSISIKEEAVRLTPDDHPDKPALSSSLGISLLTRFEHFDNIQDINRSISIFQETVRLTPDGHPNKPTHLNSLGSSLSRRFEHLGDLADIDSSISMSEEAISLTPNGHPDKPVRLNNLASSLMNRFERLGNLTDIVKSILVNEEAVSLIPDGHPNKPRLSRNLGEALMLRFQHSRDSFDLSTAAFHLANASRSSAGSADTRFRASRGWISAARLQENSTALLNAYATAIDHLPQIAWIGLPVAHRHRLLVEAADVARDGVAAALEAGFPELAVEWLEQGRSIVWTQLLQLRTPLDDLRREHPAIAFQFRQVSRQLECATFRDNGTFHHHQGINLYTDPQSLEKGVQGNHDLSLRRDKLLAEIRTLPGFDRFLLSGTFKQLAALTVSGPVIYLIASQQRCDALIIMAESEGVIHVPLPGLCYKDIEVLRLMVRLMLERHCLVTISRDTISELIHSEGKNIKILDKLLDEDCSDIISNRAAKVKPQKVAGYSPDDLLKRVLACLWHDVVEPVLQASNLLTLRASSSDKMARIFWCPSGPFSFLPIHAAGIYTTANDGRKLSDFAVSSYLPTLSSLASSPQNGLADPTPKLRLVVVPQPLTDGLGVLTSVEDEINCITELSARSHFVTVQDSSGTVEDVVEKLKNSHWVHFACHGIQDPKIPLNSGLGLANNCRLKLSDIIQLSRPQGGLAFLSACQTAQGDETLSDESVHLAAGMLLAGYSNVIGTMWAIRDDDAPKVAREVYKHLFRDSGKVPDSTEAAEALHYAIQHLRDSGASFTSWVPYIHFGK